MPWLALDLVLVAAAFGLLAVLSLRLWRQVKALTRAVGAANRTLEPHTRALSRAQAARPERDPDVP